MQYIYSKHFEDRRIERKIPQKSIEDILSENVTVVIVQSKSDPEIALHFGHTESHYLMIAVNFITKVLVTARPMQRKERIWFKEITQ